MLCLKHTVDVAGIRPEMVLAAGIVYSAFRKHGWDAKIIRGCEGDEVPAAAHRNGLALDFFTEHLNGSDTKAAVLATVERALGPQYDVRLEEEGGGKDHLHVELLL